MKKTLLLTLAAGLVVSAGLRAEEVKPAAAEPAKAEAAAAPVAKNDAPGSLKKGNELLDQGKFADAAAYFAGLEQGGRQAQQAVGLALGAALLTDAGEDAAAAAQKALDMKKDLSGAWNNLAAAEARSGKRAEAVATYEKALEALKAAGADTSKVEANLNELKTKIEEGKPKKVKEAEAKAKAEAEKAAAKAEEVKAAAEKAVAPAEKK
jgi:tetratricopeptide (TPR) repeat protein